MNGKFPEKKKCIHKRIFTFFLIFFILLKLILLFEPIILKMYNMIIIVTCKENNTELTVFKLLHLLTHK